MIIKPRSGLRSSFTPSATMRRASMSSPESVSSRTHRVGSSIAIWKISARFFSPPEKPSLTFLSKSSTFSLTEAAFSSIKIKEIHRVKFFLPAVLANRVDCGLEEELRTYTGNFHWVLKRQEDSSARTLVGIKFKQVDSVEENLTLGDFVCIVPASTHAKVLLPDPFGPMIECTSPFCTVRLTPLRISLPSTHACKFLISSNGVICSLCKKLSYARF